MASLFEIRQEILNLIDENGEVTDVEKFLELNMTKEEKVKNIGMWILNIESDADQFSEMEKKFKEKKDKALKKVASLKNYLDAFLQGEKFKSTEVNISYRKSKQLIVDDESLIPQDFFTEEVVRKLDKNLVKEELEMHPVEGCHIEEKNNIQIK